MAACVVADSHTHQSANDVLTMCASLGLVGFEWIFGGAASLEKTFWSLFLLRGKNVGRRCGAEGGGQRGRGEHGTLVISNQTVPVQSDGTVWRILVPWQLPEYDQRPPGAPRTARRPSGYYQGGRFFSCAPIVQQQISKGI